MSFEITTWVGHESGRLNLGDDTTMTWGENFMTLWENEIFFFFIKGKINTDGHHPAVTVCITEH